VAFSLSAILAMQSGASLSQPTLTFSSSKSFLLFGASTNFALMPVLAWNRSVSSRPWEIESVSIAPATSSPSTASLAFSAAAGLTSASTMASGNTRRANM
jgi:hypothetical protein